MGNMIGNGTEALPEWVPPEERQPFLYVSDRWHIDHEEPDPWHAAALQAYRVLLLMLLVLGAAARWSS